MKTVDKSIVDAVSAGVLQDYSVDLSSYVGSEDLYIKIELFQFTVEKINHPAVTTMNLNRLGVALFNVDITATQVERQFDKVISEVFYDKGDGNQTLIKNSVTK